MTYRSPFATLVGNHQDVADRPNPTAFGVMIHTTGRGLLDIARRERISPLEAAINVYTRPGAYFPHYVVYGDDAVQIADERERARHCGLSGKYSTYTSGAWESQVPAASLARWKRRWVGKKSPMALFPGRSPNAVFVGIEMIPKADATFSGPTIRRAAQIAGDVIHRHGYPLTLPAGEGGWVRCLGHEDVSPLTRWNGQGGWDPGFLRASPRFMWSTFYGELQRTRYERMLAGIQELEAQIERGNR